MINYKQQDWINGGGMLHGRRALLRKNVSLRSVAKNEYPVVVIVNLAYSNADSDGIPSDKVELSDLDATEERIADEMQAAFGALFGMVVTSDGTRDLFFFLPAPQNEFAIESAINDTEPLVDYDFSIIKDPTWRPYVELCPDAGA